MVDVVLFAVVITVALAVLFDFTNGFHDAANATSTVIATRSLSPRKAVWLSAIFNFLPAFIVGTAVANTISKTVDMAALAPTEAGAVPLGVRVTLAALIGAVFWNYLTWHLGLPSSSSHALIGGLIGAGISAGGLAVISWSSVLLVVIAIFASPLLAFVVAVLATYLVRAIQRVFGVHEDSEFFRWAQVGSSAWVSWGHGSNDAQKTMGVIAATLFAGGYLADTDVTSLEPPYWVILLAHAAIAAGTVWGGWRIIETMGLKITRITRASGFAANIGAITSIEGATHGGVPISTTQAVSASIVGSGVGERRRVNWRVMRDMVIAWFLTLPAAAAVGFCVYRLTVLPEYLAILATATAIVVLLTWAGRLMLKAQTADDIEAELPSVAELSGPSYGFQVQQTSDAEIAADDVRPDPPRARQSESAPGKDS
ncbi:MAG: inorganic phosphate transporter [Candidatus Nanopelagicales bacterium]